MNFSESLKRFRQEFGLTQKAVAACLNIQESAYRRYELGTSSPSITLVTKLADAYDISLDYLTGRTDVPNLHVFKENPKVTDEDFLEKLILDTRTNHKQRLAQAEGKIEDPAIEYADNLLRHYHKALVSSLHKAGINF